MSRRPKIFFITLATSAAYLVRIALVFNLHPLRWVPKDPARAKYPAVHIHKLLCFYGVLIFGFSGTCDLSYSRAPMARSRPSIQNSHSFIFKPNRKRNQTGAATVVNCKGTRRLFTLLTFDDPPRINQSLPRPTSVFPHLRPVIHKLGVRVPPGVRTRTFRDTRKRNWIMAEKDTSTE
jgi:hypothetical protein